MQLTDVLAIAIEDEPGKAAIAISTLSDADVNILYMYSFLWQGKGVLVMRTDKSEKAMEVIAEKNMILLTEDNFKN